MEHLRTVVSGQVAELVSGQAEEETWSPVPDPGAVAKRTTELGPGRAAEARSPAPDPEAEHEIDRDQKNKQYLFP